MKKESLGPAERMINTMLAYVGHSWHGRPGVIVPDATSPAGVVWKPAVTKRAGEAVQVLVLDAKTPGATAYARRGKKRTVTAVAATPPVFGTLQANGDVHDDKGKKVGRYQKSGLVPEIVAWIYGQIAEVWQLDNTFAAHWASYAHAQTNRDMRIILAAFMLVQSRAGAPITDGGKLAFFDYDYREVGEAMILRATDLGPKHFVRIRDVLRLPEVAAINRRLGFGRSARRPNLGRWTATMTRWLKHRETNPRMMQGLLREGYRSTVMQLAKAVCYKPDTPAFFGDLRWEQYQAEDGRRTMGLDQALAASAVSEWADLSEQGICERIVKERPSYKRIVSLVPVRLGVTPAMLAAAVEARVLSDKDLIILTPTLEATGLLKDPEVKERWEQALKAADDMRAKHIARNVKSEATQDALKNAADQVLKKEVAEAVAVRPLSVYLFVDVSSSMHLAIENAKAYGAKLIEALPPGHLRVFTFSTTADELKLQANTPKGVEHALSTVRVGGGTDYGCAVKRAGQVARPRPETDVLFFFIGDEQNGFGATFETAVLTSRLEPTAFALVRVEGSDGMQQKCVQDTAAKMELPCIMVNEAMFADAYAIPRTLSTLIASTPVGKTSAYSPRAQQKSLVDQILETKLLTRPAWANPDRSVAKTVAA